MQRGNLRKGGSLVSFLRYKPHRSNVGLTHRIESAQRNIKSSCKGRCRTKLDGNAARLSLVFQVLKWAAGEGQMHCIDLDSVKAAIRMIDYYEDTYRRIQESIVAAGIGDNKEAWLSLLGDTFTAGEAVIAGRKVELSRRTVYYALDKLSKDSNPVLEKLHHGTYRKSSPIASCTIALSSEDKAAQAAQTGQSAKVQCATDNTENYE